MLILFIVLVCTFFVFWLIHYFCKKKKPCKRALVSLLTGPVILIVLNVISSVTGVLVPLSQISLIISATLGIPGVALLVISGVLL